MDLNKILRSEIVDLIKFGSIESFGLTEADLKPLVEFSTVNREFKGFFTGNLPHAVARSACGFSSLGVFSLSRWFFQRKWNQKTRCRF
jgi:hypothetical protein